MALYPESLERIIPELLDPVGSTGRATLELHLMRYDFAVNHMQHGRVLDIACGVGYGTKLLFDKETIQTAIGVDISAEAIEYARSHYTQQRLKFIAADALEFEDESGFENIVSLETIEHVPDPYALLAHLADLLKPNGILVGSVPITPTVDVNPHHQTDFTRNSFRTMAKTLGMVEIDALIQVQAYDPIAILTGKERRAKGIRRNLPAYYLANPDRLWARIRTTIIHGFQNQYITIAWRKP